MRIWAVQMFQRSCETRSGRRVSTAENQKSIKLWSVRIPAWNQPQLMPGAIPLTIQSLSSKGEGESRDGDRGSYGTYVGQPEDGI